MKKIILLILILTLSITACTNTKDIDRPLIDNNLKEKQNEDEDEYIDVDIEKDPVVNAKKNPSSSETEDIPEFFTGEIITDGDYEIISSRISSICFVPDKESREIIKKKYSTYNLNLLEDESYSIFYDDESLTESLPDELGIFKVKIKFDIDNNPNYKRLKLIDIELTDSIGTILYEGKSYDTNDIDMTVMVKDRVCGLVVNSVDRIGEGIIVKFCGEIETEGYYSIISDEMGCNNVGLIYYDEKSKDNIPIMMGESNNNELFYFVNKEELFSELADFSSFGWGKLKTSNYYLAYNVGMGRGPSDILTEIVWLDEKYENMFEIEDISTTNVIDYNDDFAIVSDSIEFDEYNCPILFDYYYINKKNPEKVYMLTSEYGYNLERTISENKFILKTIGYNPTGSNNPHEIICKITEAGVVISNPANISVEEETEDKIINKFNLSAINDNDNQITTDGKYIYYLDVKTGYINKVNIDGTNNEPIYANRCSKLMYYKGKLYFNEHKGERSSLISSVDTDGSNYQIIYNENLINNFIIHNDVIYMTSFEEEREAGYAYGFYKYNLSDGKIETFDDIIVLHNSLGLCLINDKIYYNNGYKTREYDIKTNNIKEYDMSIHDMQEYNKYLYSYGNTYISRRELDNINNFEKIFEIDDDYIIRRISVIDDLIFFTYSYDYTERDERVVFVDVINIDGINQRNLFQFEYSTLGHYLFDKIYVFNDKLFVLSSDSQYPTFKVFDFEGKELWSIKP